MWYVRAGSKVTGPYDEDQLRALRKRGQFSPIHQISTDRIRWESSASLVKMLDSQASGSFAQLTSSPKGGTRPGQDNVNSGSDGEWYYLNQDQQQFGPVALSTIQRMLDSGSLSPSSLVYATGDADWIEISQHPALSDSIPSGSSWRWFVVGLVLVVLAVVGIGASLIIRDIQKKKAGTEEEKGKDQIESSGEDSKSGSKDPLLITSLKDEERVKQAVGLVVCGIRVKLPDGKVVEDPKSTGSCFAISSTGYLLTNRHVVDGYEGPKDSTLKVKGGEIRVVIDQPVIVFFNRIRFEAKVVHIDRTFDLAILKIERSRPQPYFAISKRNEFPRGGKCFALGFPGVANNARSEEEAALFAAKAKNDRFENILLDQNFEYSYQSGEISRVIRDAKKQYSIEHSATIFPGNSGGPLVDDRCHVIGINTQLALGKTGSLPVAFSSGQFKDLVDEFTGGIATWRN